MITVVDGVESTVRVRCCRLRYYCVLRQRELELKDRELELEAVRGTLKHREQELRQRDNDLKSREQELKRAAMLDARALGLEEERLKAVERDLLLRLKEADAALDALEAAQRGAQCFCSLLLLFVVLVVIVAVDGWHVC